MVPLPILAAVRSLPPAKPDLADAVRNAIGDCEAPLDGAVIVCARPDAIPFRLAPGARDPGFEVNGAVDSVARERHKLMEVGDTRPGACVVVGPGGWTGCMVQGWEAADQQRGFRPAGRFKR